MSVSMKRPLVAAFAAMVLAAAVLVAVLAFGRGTPATGASYDPAPEVKNAVAQVHAQSAGAPPSAAITSRFAGFKRAQLATDKLGDRDQGALATHFYADQTYAVKRLDVIDGVGAPAPDAIYVAGGTGDQLCVLYLPAGAEGPGGQCVSPDIAATGRSVFTVEHGRGAEVFGLVPDGVASVVVTLASGDTVTAPVDHNAYSVLVPTPSASISFDGPGGPVTADAPSG